MSVGRRKCFIEPESGEELGEEEVIDAVEV